MPRFPIICCWIPLVLTSTLPVFPAAEAGTSRRSPTPRIAPLSKKGRAPHKAVTDAIMDALYRLPTTESIFVKERFPPRVIRPFRCAPYVQAAVRLQALGKTQACRDLLVLAKWEDKQPYPWDNGNRAITLCRMLFVPRAGQPFRRAAIGACNFFGGTTYSDWPLEPITLIDQVPFLITKGYGGADYAEPSISYVRYCIDGCDWSSSRYRPLSQPQEEQALQKLFALPLWKKELSADDREFFAQQLHQTREGSIAGR